MIELLFWLAGATLAGALVGLIPFFVGKASHKPRLGKKGWTYCLAFGWTGLSFFIALGFMVAILVRDRDIAPPASGGYVASNPAPVVVNGPVVNTHLGISCLSGPLRGQIYPVSDQGMIIGRDHDCTIRFASNAPGISRHHCSLNWSQGVLTLTDLGSAYGTFMADGRKLPPQYPTQLAAGSRFYLANSGYLFQVVITG